MRGVGDGRPDWAQQLFQELCQGNTYTTTIWVINSVIVKLGKLTVPEKVYRGVSGRGLPKSMQEKGSGSGVGGVDVAFLSTTVDREVAFCYAKGGSGTGFGLVFEIKQGALLCARACIAAGVLATVCDAPLSKMRSQGKGRNRFPRSLRLALNVLAFIHGSA
eukprot:2061087-Prymnesium_polylepis.2